MAHTTPSGPPSPGEPQSQSPGSATHVPGAHTHAQQADPLYAELGASADFHELRRRYRAFVFPWTIAFLTWYLLFVVLSNWAPDFMGTKVVGNINVGLILGLLQFVTTFGIAWLYAKHSAKHFDPLAEKIRTRFYESEGR